MINYRETFKETVRALTDKKNESVKEMSLQDLIQQIDDLVNDYQDVTGENPSTYHLECLGTLILKKEEYELKKKKERVKIQVINERNMMERTKREVRLETYEEILGSDHRLKNKPLRRERVIKDDIRQEMKKIIEERKNNG